MTREEANEILEDWNLCHYTPSREAAEAVISALDPLEIISALRPVSREQVEKVWRGEWKSTGAISCKCSKCNRLELKSRANEYNFCPYCMSPMTDEAVQMVVERMEALTNVKTD